MKSPSNPFGSVEMFLEDIFNQPVSDRANYCRKELESLSLKSLRKLAVEADSLNSTCDSMHSRWYAMIKDVFFTKKFKPKKETKKKYPKVRVSVVFDNKGIDLIKLSSIINDPDVLDVFPNNGDESLIPSVIFKLLPPIRSKILNYTETVNSIDVNDNDTYGTGIHSCTCTDSPYCDPQHGHIITGNLQIIQNNKLRKLLTKGPNYREAKAINWDKSREKIVEGLEECVTFLQNRTNNTDYTEWKNLVLQKVDQKINQLRTRIRVQRTKQVLREPEVIEYIEELHKNFVVVPIDKASNNLAVACKKYYAEVILKEIGKLGNDSETYVTSDKSKADVIHDDCLYADHLRLKVSPQDQNLPIMYWMPKMHKNPTGARFIVASKHCSTKPVSKAISSIFKLIYNQIENCHRNAKFLANYNKFWVLKTQNR